MRGQTSDSRFQLGTGYGWIKWLVMGLVGVILMGLVWREWGRSQIVGHDPHRFNLAMIVPNQGVTFLSFDPAEKTLFAIVFPSDLVIKSRSNGEYSITSLYKLGSYSGDGGMFARRKIQGFMRLPIPGYLVIKNNRGQVKRTLVGGLRKVILGKADTSLSRLDALSLLLATSTYNYREISEDELVRAAVLEKQAGETIYHPERLQQYVGTRFFDWGIGESGVTVAVVNASGVNGLGSDMADYLTNLGLDVVMVRSTGMKEFQTVSRWEIADDPKLKPMIELFTSLFGFSSPKIGLDPEYRAQIVIQVGQDAKELF